MIKIQPPVQGVHMFHSQKKKRKNIKQKQYCNKFNRDLKNGLHPNIIISIY